MKNIILLVILCVPLFCTAQKGSRREPVTVLNVDLNRYAGVWYEIAKIPNKFQKKCRKNTTAEYILRQDGKVDVVNRCMKDNGDMISAKGLAKSVDLQTNAKLKVSFVNLLGIRLFWGDYWILGLDKEYRWVVVGDPERKYGWILCRTPVMTWQERNVADAVLMSQGYDPKKFVNTAQEWPEE